MSNVERIYNVRFTDHDATRKDGLWSEVVRYLGPFIPAQGAVLDVACDRGHFIRHVRARERWATDLRDVSDQLPADVKFVRSDGLKVAAALPHDYFDVAFMSNYLEHLPSADSVIHQFQQVAAVLRPGGRVIVLQPNIRLVGGRYWDFIDHTVPLTERSLAEAASLAGFRCIRLITRFLPYTTKSVLPNHPHLVRAYLHFPPAWLLMGKQTLYIGEKP